MGIGGVKMQDRLKFRCWDDYNREMLDLQEQDTNPYNISDFAQHNIMQCTGLKDKNGKLIYEGDVVKDDHDAWHYVRWVYDSWQLFPCTQNNYTIGIVDDEIEVIGNIYENPELIGGLNERSRKDV